MTTSTQQDWLYPGSRWWKFDFHTHTPASKDTVWYKLKGTDDELSPEAWLIGYMVADIDCMAVTDHNSGAWVDRLKAAYVKMKAQAEAGSPPEGFRKLTLFPAVELSVQGGFHLLAIFDPGVAASDIDTLLGGVDYDGTKGDSDGVTRKGGAEVARAVLDAGGIPVPAHADRQGNSGKALLAVHEGTRKCQLDATTVCQVLDTENLLAMEWEDMGNPLPGCIEKQGGKLARVLGSDCHNLRGEHLPGSRYTWVKMATPSLEGLRLALMDGEDFSIRRSDDSQPFDPFKLPEHFIEAIEIGDARYMGRGQPTKLEFSPWFNALIGGRGTGKSTVIHMLRLALRREGELKCLDDRSEPRVTFERFNWVARNRTDKGGLLDSTSIKLTLMRDGVRHYLHWRQDGQYGQGVVVEEEGVNGRQASVSQSVTSERFPVRIFSQGQIAALADEGQQALLGVIDEAASTATQQATLKESRRRFLTLCSQVRELDGKLQGHDALTVQLEDVNRKLQRFEEAHHADVLKNFQRCKRQRREVERQFDSVEGMARSIDELVEVLQLEDLPDGLFDPASDEDCSALVIGEALSAIVRKAATTMHETAQGMHALTNSQRIELGKTAWQAGVDKATSEYQSLVKMLQAQGVTDPSEYGRLVQERQRLDGGVKRLESLRQQRDKLAGQVQVQLESVTEVRRTITQARQDFLEQVLVQNPFVRIGLLPYGRDPISVERSLRDVLGVPDDRFSDDILVVEDDQPKRGLVADLLSVAAADLKQRQSEIEEQLDNLKQRIKNACLGKGDFGGHFNNYLTREFNHKPEFLDRMLVWFPEDALKVEYSRGGDGKDFQPITQASAGQRAAAMLAFLLAHGEEPLILDQPEDDLDNHLIYDLVVRQIRENKVRRQIIVVSHNPNIVVNGDAEMLHALDFANGQCYVVQAGSLQEKAMREEVCHVMEGGREAFERRYRRLGREVSDV